MLTEHSNRRAQSATRTLGSPILLSVLLVWAWVGCDPPPTPSPRDMYVEPEPARVEEVSPKVCTDCDPNGVLKVGELEAFGIKLPASSELAGEVNASIFVRSPHSLTMVRAFFEKYYSDYVWEPGDGRFGFSLSTPGNPDNGVKITVAKGWAGRVKIIVSKRFPKGQAPKHPSSGNEDE